jgi:hypothetical protein
MSDLLTEVCSIALYAIAPGLLVVRFFWPRLLPRWGVLLAVALLGGAVFYFREWLYQQDMLALAQRYGAIEDMSPHHGEGMVALQRPRPVDFVLGSALELVYLLLLLVPYGIIRIVRDRRKQAVPIGS